MRSLHICATALTVLVGLAACSSNDGSGAGSGTGSGGQASTNGNGGGANAGSGTGNDTGAGANRGGNGSMGGSGATNGSGLGGAGTTGTGASNAGGAVVSTGTLNACATVSGKTTSSSAPPIIEFVLDNTNSMSDTTQASTGGKSKWEALQAAFTAAIPTLATDHPEYAVGLTYFHYKGNGAGSNGCTDALQAVEIAALTSQQSTTLVANVNAEGQIVKTPTQDIWQFGADHALAWGATDAVYAASNRYVVVLTDGVPTVAGSCAAPGGCASTGGTSITVAQYQQFIDAVSTYKADKKVTTFMIAIPGAEALNQVTCTDGSGVLYTPITKMQDVATAGGTSLIDLTTSATTDFTTALIAAITEQIGGAVESTVSCDYPVPTPPTDANGNTQFIDSNAVEVWYYANGGGSCVTDSTCATGQKCSPSTAAYPSQCYGLIPRSVGCTNLGGWDYADSTNSTITLCSSACSTAKADSAAKIEVMIGCFQVG